jgi:hypothetical protein
VIVEELTERRGEMELVQDEQPAAPEREVSRLGVEAVEAQPADLADVGAVRGVVGDAVLDGVQNP